MFSDFSFWLRQQPPETQQKIILGLIGIFVIMLVVCAIAEYIKRKKEE